MTKTRQSLEIKTVTDGSGTCGYVSKGHHDFDAFVRACNAYAEESMERRWDNTGPTVSERERHLAFHDWLRCVPMPPGSNLGYRFQYMDAEPHTRGAFPATVIYL